MPDCNKAKKLIDIAVSEASSKASKASKASSSLSSYTISDIKEKELLWDFNLASVLSLQRKSSVFANFCFYFLPETWSKDSISIKKIPPQEEMILILKSGGGIVIDKLPSSSNSSSIPNLLIISPPIEIISSLSSSNMTMINKIGKNGAGKGLYSVELILSSCLSQSVDINKNIVKKW